MMSGLLVTLLLCGLAIGANAGCNIPTASCCSSCLPGWTWFGGRCYVFEASTKTWPDAEKYCNSYGGNLVSLQSTDQYNFIRDLIYTAAGTNQKAWVGGTNAVRNDMWFWSDGSTFAFDHWGKGEPNNQGGNEHCMDINLFGQDYVNDEVCSQLNPFVCATDL